MRTISASRSVGGSAPRPSPPAASSSSANSGLPSLRPYRRSMSSAVGPRLQDVLELVGELAAGEAARARSGGRARRAPARPAAGAAGGGGAARPSGRWRPRARARCSSRGARKARNARVELSAQWMSSSSSTTGLSRPSRSSSESSASNSRRWAAPATPSSGARRRAAGIRARAAASRARRAPHRRARASTGSPSRASGRRAATSGAYGSSPSPSSTHSPQSVRAPRSFGRGRRTRTTSRDLPTPDSPATNAIEGWPSAAAAQGGLELRELARAADQAGAGDAGATTPKYRARPGRIRGG